MRYPLAWLSMFAVAMAELEATVVIYLRKLYYPDDLRALFPLRFIAELDFVIELARQAATVVMLLAVALLAEHRRPVRTFAAFVFVFGLWDIFYYAWLKLLIDWPSSWLEWDVLFLIPWIWLGPWICPVLIALAFVVWGFRVLRSGEAPPLSAMSLNLFVAGSLLCLTAFLQPAVPVLLRDGIEGMQHYSPGGFWWWLFLPGLTLMIVGLARTTRPNAASL